jgi:hypothetical protein
MPTPKYRGLKSPQTEVEASVESTPEPEQNEDVMTESAPAKASSKKEKMYTVKFHSQEGPGGKDDIVVHAGNTKDIGKNWRIKREAEVQIPERAMNVIMEAKITKWETDEKTKKSVSKEVDRFAYTIIRVDE